MGNMEKYSIEKLEKYPQHTWTALVGIMIANELTAMNSILKKETNE